MILSAMTNKQILEKAITDMQQYDIVHFSKAIIEYEKSVALTVSSCPISFNARTYEENKTLSKEKKLAKYKSESYARKTRETAFRAEQFIREDIPDLQLNHFRQQLIEHLAFMN